MAARQADTRAELARLEELLAQCEDRRPEGLRFEDLRELAQRQRRAGALLARLREQGRDPEAIRYVNALCVRAHSALTVPQPRARHPLAPRIRAALGRSWAAQGVAWSLLLVGIYVGATAVVRDPRAAHELIPSTFGYTATRLDGLLHSAEARDAFFAPAATPVSENLFFGSQLFANNTRVGLLAMAAGILAGIPTVLLTLFNGTLLGAFTGMLWQPGHRIDLLAWLLPHGIPEFTAILLCASAGLLLGMPLVSGGRLGRRAAWRQAADSALVLFGLSVPLFLLAAGIESFVRESALGVAPRLAVAAAMGVGLATGLLLLRRTKRPIDVDWLHADSLRDPGGAPGSD